VQAGRLDALDATYVLLRSPPWPAQGGALVDHLFDYPTVPLLAGMVLGWASTSGGVRHRDGLDTGGGTPGHPIR